jgi:hypothetical protein
MVLLAALLKHADVPTRRDIIAAGAARAAIAALRHPGASLNDEVLLCAACDLLDAGIADDHDAMDALLSALRTHGAAHALFVSLALCTLRRTAGGIVDESCMSVILSAMRVHTSDAAVQRAGCTTLHALLMCSAAVNIATAVACKALPVVLNATSTHLASRYAGWEDCMRVNCELVLAMMQHMDIDTMDDATVRQPLEVLPAALWAHPVGTQLQTDGMHALCLLSSSRWRAVVRAASEARAIAPLAARALVAATRGVRSGAETFPELASTSVGLLCELVRPDNDDGVDRASLKEALLEAACAAGAMQGAVDALRVLADVAHYHCVIFLALHAPARKLTTSSLLCPYIHVLNLSPGLQAEPSRIRPRQAADEGQPAKLRAPRGLGP